MDIPLDPSCCIDQIGWRRCSIHFASAWLLFSFSVTASAYFVALPNWKKSFCHILQFLITKLIKCYYIQFTVDPSLFQISGKLKSVISQYLEKGAGRERAVVKERGRMEVKQRRNYPLPIWSFSPVPIPLSSSFILAIPMFSLLPNSLFCLSSHSFFSLLILFIVPASNIQMFFRFHDSLAMLSPYHKAMKTSSFPSHLPQHNRHPLFHHHDTIMYPYLVFLYEMFQNEVWL